MLQVEVFKITAQLLLSTLIVGVASPNLQFDNVLFAEIINHYVHAVVVACLLFDMVAAYLQKGMERKIGYQR